MKKFSNQFLTLLLVLLSIGAFDFHTLLGHIHSSHGSVNSGPWPAASAVPLYANSEASMLQARSRKPRVGIVVKSSSGSSLKSGATPLNTITTGGSKSSSSVFENPDGRVGMKVQLKRLERNQDGNPLMLYQRHINRANSKLASILGRAAPTSAEMQQALERRKLSILARRGLLSEDPSILSRSSQRITSPRQGYTTHTTSGGELQRRFLSSIMDDLFGRTGLESGSEAKPTIQQVANEGYPQADLIASQSANLTLASAPTTVQILGLDIESNDIGYVATIEIGSANQTFRMLIDSGSADTWVPSTSCSACGSTHTQLGGSTSDTFQSRSTSFSITYGTGE
ncbi:hypothetical protein, partial [Sporisorium scitamineum]